MLDGRGDGFDNTSAELNGTYVPVTQTRSGAQAAAALTVIDTGATGKSLVILQDDATHDAALLTQYHYGNTAALSYGIDILNFPGARTALVTHQYDNTGPAWWLDNCGAGAGLRIHNTQNLTNAPGQDGTGPYIELQDHGITIASLTKALVFSRLSSSVTQGDTPFTFLSTVGKALSVQQSVANTTTLEVIKASTGAGNAVDVSNAGTGVGLHVNQTGAGRGIQVDANVAANAGVFSALIQGYDYGSSFTTDADGGTTLTLTKNGTGAGTVIKATNKGTGDSLQLFGASSNMFGVAAGGFINVIQGVSVNVLAGTGSPEGVKTAVVGSIFLRTDGGIGTSLYFKETGAGNTGWAATGTYSRRGEQMRASGVLAETYPRTSTISNQGVLNDGKESLQGIWFEAGTSITNIAFCSATTAASVPLNQWFTIRSSARALLAITADDTTTAWAANSIKSLAITGGPYVVPTTGFYYLGCMVHATTPPTLGGGTNIAAIVGLTQKLMGFDNTNSGLTNPASAPATSASLVTLAANIYAYVT